MKAEKCSRASRCARCCPVVDTPAAASRAPIGRHRRLPGNACISGWLPTSGLQLDARPMLEHYPIDAKFDPNTGVF